MNLACGRSVGKGQDMGAGLPQAFPSQGEEDVHVFGLSFGKGHTPTYASWANPIESHFGPLRQFSIANSNHTNHTMQTRALHAHLRWRNANARHRDVLAAEHKERARIRSEKGIRWGGRLLPAAA